MRPIRLDLAQFRDAPAPVDPAKVRAGAPHARYAGFFSAASGSLDVGVWEATAGAWTVDYTETEICLMLAGRVRLEGGPGESDEFGAGECFLVPAGYRGTWTVLEPARKLYVIHQAG